MTPDRSQNQSLRKHLLFLLQGEGAHASVESVVKDVPAEIRGKRPKGSAHSPWEVLEHMRIALWDILEFTRNPEHVSPDFPAGYWPKEVSPSSDAAWNASVTFLRSTLNDLAELARDENNDLFAPIPHGDGQTILREILLAVDHTAYHLGELVLIRRLLGAWE